MVRFPYPLRVHLTDIGQTLGESVCRHLVAKLVPEFGGLRLGPLGEGSGVRNGTSDDTANRWRELEDVRYGFGVDQLVLVQLGQHLP